MADQSSMSTTNKPEADKPKEEKSKADESAGGSSSQKSKAEEQAEKWEQDSLKMWTHWAAVTAHDGQWFWYVFAEFNESISEALVHEILKASDYGFDYIRSLIPLSCKCDKNYSVERHIGPCTCGHERCKKEEGGCWEIDGFHYSRLVFWTGYMLNLAMLI